MNVLTALFWPLFLLGYGMWKVATPTTAREHRAELKAMQERKAQLQRDIGRLERQEQIGQD